MTDFDPALRDDAVRLYDAYTHDHRDRRTLLRQMTALVVGLVLPFDRLLDMTRTVPSASANLTVATLVARGEGALDDARLRGRVAA